MTKNRTAVTSRQLIVAVVAAGIVSVLLIAALFWLRDWVYADGRVRFTDGGWWMGVARHLLGYLALGKVGFKVALAVIIGCFGLAAWARSRRVQRPPDDGA